MTKALTIEEKTDNGTHVLTLVGRLDTNTAAQLKTVTSRIYASDAAADIVMDLGACEFVSSAGLRILVAMQKRSTVGGSLRFCHVPPEVMEVFESTGFDKILVFE